jgi:type IV secretory pathway VirB10-like protein
MKILPSILLALSLCAGIPLSQAQVIGVSKNVPMERPEIKKVKTRELLRGDFIPIVFQVTQPSEEFPTPVVAMVTRNISNIYDSEVLIPAGSRLIGGYMGGVARAQVVADILIPN